MNIINFIDPCYKSTTWQLLETTFTRYQLRALISIEERLRYFTMEMVRYNNGRMYS